MRPLKFRTWHPKSGMSYPFTIDDIIEAACCKHYPKYPRKEYITMQYTGLKDKNGVEIYEGDVVEWSDGKLLSEVYWDQADVAFSLRWNGESWFLNDDSMLCGMEVVGNIYENHELVDK